MSSADLVTEDRSGWPVERRLEQRIIDGDRDGLEADLGVALGDGWPAFDVVNGPLLGGMKVVGELFGSGQMQLPFVLQSAETMKSGGRLPRAPHGEGRRRRQGPHRARDRQR